MREIAKWLFGLIVLAAVMVVVLHAAELRNFTLLLQRAQPRLLIVAVGLQLSTYLWLALIWKAVLDRLGTPLTLRQLFPVSLAKLFADQAVPSAGISGNVLLVQSLKSKGVSGPHAVTAMALSIIADYAAYIIMAVTALALLWLHNQATILLATSISVFLGVAFLILAATAFLISRRGKIPKPLKRFAWPKRIANLLSEVPRRVLSNRALLGRVTALYAFVFLADAATLWVVLAAVGYPLSFAMAFIALILASIAATLAPIPMGLGSFEAVCIATLRSLGAPIEAGAAATLIFRALALWLPLIPGLIVARQMARTKA